LAIRRSDRPSEAISSIAAGGRATGASSKGLRLSYAAPSAYRGPQQKVPGYPTSAVIPEAPLVVKSSRKCVKSLLLKRRVTPHRALPGCPTRITGVPNKKYRGTQQKLPGCPTRITGVPNKKYRGTQQVGSGNLLQVSGFFAFRGVSLYCYV
jgi:hypothetical protein